MIVIAKIQKELFHWNRFGKLTHIAGGLYTCACIHNYNCLEFISLKYANFHFFDFNLNRSLVSWLSSIDSNATNEMNFEIIYA